MEYDPHPDLPEFMRVPVDFSQCALLAYLNDQAGRFELSAPAVRIFMSQTQLYSHDELTTLTSTLSTDALFQIEECIALNPEYWLDHAHVVDLFGCLDRVVVFRFDSCMSEASAGSIEFELLVKALVCVMYRRAGQDDEEWLRELSNKIESARLKKVPFSLICNPLPLLVKEYFEAFLISSSSKAVLNVPNEPPIAHPLLGAIKADLDIVGRPYQDVSAHNGGLIRIVGLDNDDQFMSAWHVLNDNIVSGRVADETLEREIEGLTGADISKLVDRFYQLWQEDGPFSSGAIVIKELYENLISRLVRLDVCASSRPEIISSFTKLVRWLNISRPDHWDFNEMKSDIKRLYRKSMLKQEEYLRLESAMRQIDSDRS